MIGHVIAYSADLRNRFAWLASIVAPPFMGKGVMMEATGLFIGYLFANWELRKIYIEATSFAFQSYASGEDKLFRHEGLLRGHHYHNGSWYDQHILAIYREDAEKWLHAYGLDIHR